MSVCAYSNERAACAAKKQQCKNCEKKSLHRGKWCKNHTPRCQLDGYISLVRKEGSLCSAHQKTESVKAPAFPPLEDKRVYVAKKVALISFDKIREAAHAHEKIMIQDGEDFCSFVSWSRPEKMVMGKDFFISDSDDYEDCHNSGKDVLVIGKYSSYSASDDNGIYRRREGHEHLVRVYKEVQVLEPLISKQKDGSYRVAGNEMSETEMMARLNIVK